MKLNQPIDIDLKLFFLKGEFDCIKPGQTKEWILNNFADPDSNWDNEYGQSIWTYNSLEFHFDKDQLYLIWCDGLSHLTPCHQLNYTKWFLDDDSPLTLSYVLHILNVEAVNYKVKHNIALHIVQVKIIDSNVTLHFEQLEETKCQNSNEYEFIAFGLSHGDYETF